MYFSNDAAALDHSRTAVEFGVNRRRWRILATLSAAEGITVSNLSRRAELDIAQTSRAIGTLAREGYLKRLANPKNARFSQVILTEKGRNLTVSRLNASSPIRTRINSK